MPTMQNYVSEYFRMIGRETAIPGWMGNKKAGRAAPSAAEMSFSEKKDQDAEYTSRSVNSLYGSETGSPQLGVLSAEDPSPIDNGYEVEQRKKNGLSKVKSVFSTGPSDAEHQQDKKRTGLGKYWAIIATGAGLFSDGYVNNGAGLVVTMLKTIYPKSQYSKSSALSNIASIAFAGTVVGQLGFGFIADNYSRKAGMIISTLILIIFSILAAGSWGVGMPSNPGGMFAALTVYRAILGIGIGGEYPAGSVACAEASQMLGSGTRNRWFIWFTNTMIDSGFVVSATVAWVLLWICNVPAYAKVGDSHGLGTAWRLLLGLGALPPLSLLYLRVKFDDNDSFKQNNFRKARTPWWLVIKRYGPRLVIVSLIWFIYDFCTYSFSIYSSQIIASQVPVNADGVSDIKTSFGWTIVFNLFYMPGSFLGGFSADIFGARLTLCVGTLLQGIVGVIMASQYDHLMKHIAPLVVAYGIFETLGEFGPGDNIGLVCSKTSGTAVRGRYYAVAAAMGKIGAFVGGYAFPAIADHYGGIDSTSGQKVLLWVSSALCLFSAVLSACIPELSQEAVALEDIRFRNYLADNGYDPEQLTDYHYKVEEKGFPDVPEPARI